MKYLMLIYTREETIEAFTPEENAANINGYFAFNRSLRDDQLLGGNALRPVSTATTVRIQDGQRTVTDGPFAETREQLGGYYLIEAADLDEAIEIAARIPAASHGCVEVRPLMEYEGAAG